MRHFKWDGKTCQAIFDSEGNLCALLIPGPVDSEWEHQVINPATSGIAIAAELLDFNTKNVKHRRGDFAAVAMGISHGGGQTRPSVLHQTKRNRPILDTLLSSRPLRRLAGHIDTVVQAWAPRLHGYYSGLLNGLEEDDPQLKRPIPGSAFAACTINFGPKTETLPHRDYGNLSWGWCTVTALGNFNHELGGQLTAWDLNCMFDLPPGSTIALQSALIHHSNISIAEGETRYSFAQYTAGSLFRWVDGGFKPTSATKQKEVEQGRWEKGLAMLSKMGELSITSKSDAPNVLSNSNT
ncbi:hypothetical protein BDN70DRAFT_909297 [Pholiota conissans]|uniref:Uncharacterized protein n=1 Tax=Pholiota conissans TaxID=109636 RepID=A0A9P6CS57_9AGAR|nr:hypothetical protein BDN70DRAFT_909297 [Pholiota conissans]